MARIRLSRSDTRLLVLGDSHSACLRPFAGVRRGCALEVLSLEGVSAAGLKNPNSLSDGLRTFRLALRLAGASHVALMLGEVDAGFLAWMSSDPSDSAESRMIRAVEQIESIADSSAPARIAVIGIPPPTILSYAGWDGLGGARSGCGASLSDRAALTHFANYRLKSIAERRQWAFVGLDQIVPIDPNGLPAEKWQSADESDHHLEESVLGPALLQALITGLGLDTQAAECLIAG